MSQCIVIDSKLVLQISLLSELLHGNILCYPVICYVIQLLSSYILCYPVNVLLSSYVIQLYIMLSSYVLLSSYILCYPVI